jgi:DNA-binding NarL/FixJ family response regulator
MSSKDRRIDLGRLSMGEARIVRLVAEGLTDEEIARHLSIAVHDVSAEMAAVVQKLGLRSRTELALLVPNPTHERRQGGTSDEI